MPHGIKPIQISTIPLHYSFMFWVASKSSWARTSHSNSPFPSQVSLPRLSGFVCVCIFSHSCFSLCPFSWFQGCWVLPAPSTHLLPVVLQAASFLRLFPPTLLFLKWPDPMVTWHAPQMHDGSKSGSHSSAFRSHSWLPRVLLTVVFESQLRPCHTEQLGPATRTAHW